MPFGIAGLAFAGGTRKRGAQILGLLVIVSLGLFSASCGGGASRVQNAAVPVSSSSYSITILGSSSATQFSTTVNVIVQ